MTILTNQCIQATLLCVSVVALALCVRVLDAGVIEPIRRWREDKAERESAQKSPYA